MRLPRGEQILSNTLVRYVDFDSLIVDDFISSLKKGGEKTNGYFSITYHDRLDVVVVFENQIRDTFRYVKNHTSPQEITFRQIVTHANKDPEGIVNYYKMPLPFLEMLRRSCLDTPALHHLNWTFVRWKDFLNHLQHVQWDGFLEVFVKGSLNFILIEKGNETASFWVTQNFSGEEAFKIRLFDSQAPHFISLQKQIKLTFLDIFADFLRTTYSILAQDKEAEKWLQHSLIITQRVFPKLFKNVECTPLGLINLEVLIQNIAEFAPVEQKDVFIDGLLCLLHERLKLIKKLFGASMLERTLSELKMVHLYHQQSLKKFGISTKLLAFWKQFE